MSAPLLTVCLTTYQQSRYIRACLDGILMQQTDFDFNVIIGDDESTDGTSEICAEYAQRHPDKVQHFRRSRIDVIHINGHPTGRFNFIQNLNAATGEYIALCEGDDYWTDPKKLQLQVDFLRNHPEYSMCFTRAKKIDENDNVVGASPALTKDVYDIVDFGKGNVVFTATAVFRRSNLASFPMKTFVRVPAGDYFLNIFNASKGLLKYLDVETAAYRVHPGSTWASKNATYQLLNAVYSQYIIISELPMRDEARAAFLKGINDFIDSLFAIPELDLAKELPGYKDPHFQLTMEVLYKRHLDCKAQQQNVPPAQGSKWKGFFGRK